MISILTNNYEGIIRECFSSDQELLDKFHVEAPASLDKCVERTINDLKVLEDFKFYLLLQDGNTIGYFGIENHDFLTSYFLKPEYRNLKNEFWLCVTDRIGNEFKTAIHSKNTRAKKFLSKYGELTHEISLFQMKIVNKNKIECPLPQH